jgi:phage shock protein PspC (stress-responsive transcriptional regulator)
MTEKRLYRSTTDRRVAGVCGGLADYFGLDATLVRILYFVALILPGGIGILPYVVLWIVLPEQAGITGTKGSSAVTIAEERYARGEITVDELARIRQDLST